MERGQLGTTPPGGGVRPTAWWIAGAGSSQSATRRGWHLGARLLRCLVRAEFEEEERKGAKGGSGGRTGIVADRASRRARRELRANERTRVTSPGRCEDDS